MRPLQLTILITTAVVLFAAAGYAMWHVWQEQELPREEQGDEGEKPKRLIVNLRTGGRVYVQAYEFRLQRPVEAERRDELLALEDALRTLMRHDPALGDGLRSGRWPLIIYADAAAAANHIETIRTVCRARGIARIEVQTKAP